MTLRCYRCAAWPCVCKDGQTIIHGDCREVLSQERERSRQPPGESSSVVREVPQQFDKTPLVEGEAGYVLILDPPYGYEFASGWDSSHRNQQIANDSGTECRDFVIAWAGSLPWACFGSWRVIPPEGAKTALVWDKGPASGMGDLRVPWKCSWEVVWIGGHGWHGRRDEGVLRGHSVVTWETRGRRHVNEKPISLINAILAKAPGNATVLDPFLGSGTTLRACKDLGRRGIGIEIEERYCEIAANRLKQGVLEFTAQDGG